MARKADSILDQIRELVGIDTGTKKKAKKGRRAKKNQTQTAAKKTKRKTAKKSKRTR